MVDKVRTALAKVPEISAIFWIIKVLTTGMGESTSDYLVTHIAPALAVGLGALGIVFALVLQFSVRRYVPWVYWLTVVMVAIFGTMAADVLHVGLGIPYIVTTAAFALSLAIIFALWYSVEGTLSIHSIYTRRRELFYWATVMATFALGTAAGDMTAATLGLGYLLSGILFAILIAFIAVGHFMASIYLTAEHRHPSRNAVIAFWLAYILTRPLGASLADWMGKGSTVGGLGWGDGTVSLYLLALIVVLVGYLTIKNRSRKNNQ